MALSHLFAFSLELQAKEQNVCEPAKYGISGIVGYTFDPSTVYFTQASFCALYDYDQVWWHRAPDTLKFKVEGSAGVSYLESGDARVIANVGMLALRYLNTTSSKNFKPYVEAGIGITYTDYRVEGQAYRVNFNPQAGIGFEYTRKSGRTHFGAFRVHHLSNGSINSQNRGQNSILIMLGQYF